MGGTTYLLGAGINRGITGPNGLFPPLARDFFRQALRHPRISAEFTIRQLAPLFEFIEKYWHLTQDELKNADFDLEECFTFLELQRREAAISRDQQALASTSRLQWILTQLFLDFMSECEHWFFQSSDFREFGSRLLNAHATIITLNYDTLLESALAAASPPRLDTIQALFTIDPQEDNIRDEEIAYSFHEWNPYVAYKVQFDEVGLQTPGISRIVEGPRYYGHVQNQAELPAFLKLHGSLGWFFHSGYFIDGTPLEGEVALRAGRSVLRRGGTQGLRSPELDYSTGEILLPLIITPVLNKPYDQHSVFRTIWELARSELHSSNKLVIGGYSFPPTDFHVRRLLREVFSDKSLEELWVINPDTKIVQIAKDLCNYNKPVIVCKDIGEFLTKDF